MDSITELADRAQATALGVWLSESAYAFPIVEGIHLIGLSLSVGLIFLTDLRLMGLLLRHVPALEVVRQLRPYVLAGFAAVFITGILLFYAEAPTLVASPAFPFKLLFIALAGANAWYFERITSRRADVQQAASTAGAVLPSAVGWAGLSSLLLWTLVVICGRLIPYLPSWP